MVTLAEEGGVDHAEDRVAVAEQGERGRALRDAVGEVGRPVDGVKGPQPSPGRAAGLAFFLAEEPDARRGLGQVGADLAGAVAHRGADDRRGVD